MKRGLLRTTVLGASFIFVTLLFINFVYKSQHENIIIQKEKDEFKPTSIPEKQQLIEASAEEKFMSFLPHG
jgi:preprotein translocase subunit SecG